MAKELRVGRAQTVVGLCVMVLSGTYGFLGMKVILARQSGLGPAAAVREAIGRDSLSLAVFLFVSAVVALGVFRFVMPRTTGEGVSPESARAAGSRRWRRMRLLATVLALPLMLIAAGWAGYDLLTGKDVPEHVLWMLGLAILYAAAALVYWIVKPSREYLYVLGTGDRSQIDDERAREVKGRAADTAIPVLLGIVLLVGVPYEVAVQGVLPIRSFVEMAVILLVWGLASWRWKRRL